MYIITQYNLDNKIFLHVKDHFDNDIMIGSGNTIEESKNDVIDQLHVIEQSLHDKFLMMEE
jgi:hypothetical protein